MPFLSSWATDDYSRLLHFEPEVLEVFRNHIQRVDTDCEAGGLLLGTVHGEHLLIKQATTPTPRDRRFRALFERMPFGHATIASMLWAQSSGQVRYLGEWHTHSQDSPTPSELDRSEWRRLSRRRSDGRPLLAVIVGRADLHAELVFKRGGSSQLRGAE